MGAQATDKPYTDYGTYLRERYGQSVYRVPIDLGLSCPNRENGGAGCAYCGTFGARAVHLGDGAALREQVDVGVRLARERYGAEGFIAYFQAFTSTYAPTEKLQELYEQALGMADFRAVAISTRPDCLPAKTVDLLASLMDKYDIWVELGVQTSCDETLNDIFRGHDFACSEKAIRTLAERGINVAAHVILGLPGERQLHFQNTAEALAQLPLSGIKIHNLHVVRDTAMAELWRLGQVRVMDEHEYAEILIDFLRRLPPEWPIMRLVSDTPAKQLVAPQWWMKKPQFIDYIENQMHQRGQCQGDLLKAGKASNEAARHEIDRNVTQILPPPENKSVVETASGIKVRLPPEILPPSNPVARGLAAAARLDSRLHAGNVILLDIGFGHGPGLLGAIEMITRDSPHYLRLVGLGFDASIVSEMQSTTRDLLPIQKRLLAMLAVTRDVQDQWGRIKLYWGDPRRNLFRIRGHAHVIYIEPRVIEKCVELFSVDFLLRVSRILSPRGTIVTPCSSVACRNTFCRIGLHVGKCDPGLVPGGGTVAAKDESLIPFPLSARERRIMEKSLSGVPYRDTLLTAARREILDHRQHVVSRLRRLGWQKRLKFW